MGAKQLSELHRLYEEAFNTRNAEALLDLYGPQAKLIPGPGQEVVGHDDIKAALERFFALQGTIKLRTIWVVQAGDLALMRGRWTLKGTGPDGKAVDMEGHCIDVLRREPAGTWVLEIDNPFGGADCDCPA